MVTLNVGSLVLAFIAAMGIPSAIMGIIVRRMEKRIAKRDEAREAKDKAQEQLLLLIVQPGLFSVSLMPIAMGICTKPWRMPQRLNMSRRIS